MSKRGEKKPKNRKKRLLIIGVSVFFFVACVLAFLQAGVLYTQKKWSHFSPNYEKVDILPLLEKSERSDLDYEILYRQTGLTKLGIDDLLEEKNEKLILEIQDFLFQDHAFIRCLARRANSFTLSHFQDLVNTYFQIFFRKVLLCLY